MNCINFIEFHELGGIPRRPYFNEGLRGKFFDNDIYNVDEKNERMRRKEEEGC